MSLQLLHGTENAIQNAHTLHAMIASHNITATPCYLPDGDIYVDITDFTNHDINNVWIDLTNCIGFISEGITNLYISTSNEKPYKAFTFNGPAGLDYEFENVHIQGPPKLEIDVNKTPNFNPFEDVPLTYAFYSENHEVGSVKFKHCSIKGNFTIGFIANKNTQPGRYELILEHFETDVLGNCIDLFSSYPSKEVWLKAKHVLFLGAGTPVLEGIGRGAHVYAHGHVNLYFEKCKFFNNYRRCVQHRGTNITTTIRSVAIYKRCFFGKSTNIGMYTSDLATTYLDHCRFHCSYQGVLNRNVVISKYSRFYTMDAAIVHQADRPTSATILHSSFKNSPVRTGGNYVFHNCYFYKKGHYENIATFVNVLHEFDNVFMNKCYLRNKDEAGSLQAFVYIHKGLANITKTDLKGNAALYAAVLSIGSAEMVTVEESEFSLAGTSSIPSRALRVSTPFFEHDNEYNVQIPITAV